MGSSTPRKILAALDFGTTFSGVAWAQTASPDKQTIIQEWPGKDGTLTHTTDEKVPTEILYQDFQAKWGFQIPAGEPRYIWFKLGLNEDDTDQSYLSSNLQASHELPPSYDKGHKDLATDYLRCIRDHVVGALERSIGKAIVKSTPLEFTITVPAIWTEKAKKLTLQCAKEAGLGESLRIVSEPEAAGIHTLDVLDIQGLRENDNMVVFDAGGGTVDIISLRIQKLGKPVELVESVPGTGYKCGATFLNRRFRKMLIDEYSMLEGWDDIVLQEAETYFEDYIKKYFSGTESYRVPIFPLADDPGRSIKGGRLLLSAANVEAVFSPVVASATTLLSTQLKKTSKVKKVLLVGGFSSSPYLRNSVKKIMPARVELLIPPYARTAVVRGALIKALADENPTSAKLSVIGRAARKHYGLLVLIPYEERVHLRRRQEREWSGYHGMWMISSVKWFIERGDILQESQPQTQTFVSHGLESSLSWSDISAHIYSWESPSNGGRTAPKDPSQARELTILTADLSDIPDHLIPQLTGRDGKSYYHLEYEIRMKFLSANTEYSLWYNGVRYGTVEAEYC